MGTIVLFPDQLTASQAPAAGSAATADSQAPNLNGGTIIVTSVYFGIAANAAAQPPLEFRLIDLNAGGLLFVFLSAPIGGSATFVLPDLSIPISAGAQARVAAMAAPVADCRTFVGMTYYTSGRV